MEKLQKLIFKFNIFFYYFRLTATPSTEAFCIFAIFKMSAIVDIPPAAIAIEAKDTTPSSMLTDQLSLLSSNVSVLLNHSNFVTKASFTNYHGSFRDLCIAEGAYDTFNSIFTNLCLDQDKPKKYAATQAAKIVCTLIAKGTLKLCEDSQSVIDEFTPEKMTKNNLSLEARRGAVMVKLQKRIENVKTLLNSTPEERAKHTLSKRRRERLPAASTPCKFYPSGTCRNGTRCRFLHGQLSITEAANLSSTAPVAAPAAAPSSQGKDGTFCSRKCPGFDGAHTHPK